MDGEGKNGSAAAATGAWQASKCETSPPGSTSPRIADSRKWYWLGTAPAGQQLRQYQAEKQDRRVVGVVVASGSVRPGTGPTDPDQIAQATRMMADGRPDDLVRDPKRSFPSFISAATMLDIVNTPPEFKDFFGTQTETKNPGVTRIRCPLLAFFGTKGDVGNEADLELLKSSIKRQSSGPSRVNTVMIQRRRPHVHGRRGTGSRNHREMGRQPVATGGAETQQSRQTVGVGLITSLDAAMGLLFHVGR